MRVAEGHGRDSFGFPAQRCVQSPNPQCAVVKIPPTSELSLFCLLTGEENQSVSSL